MHTSKDGMVHEAFMMPMVEGSCLDVPLLIHRTWTLVDIKESMQELPEPRELGGQKFGEELLIFCREFQPTTNELCRLFMIRLGVDWSKVSSHWPANDLCLIQTEWNHQDNVAYVNVLMQLQERFNQAFPVRMDMTKIVVCKQNDDEPVSAYLVKLMEMNERHCGIDKPMALAAGDAPLGVWEAHLRNSFISGLSPPIVAMVKQQ